MKNNTRGYYWFADGTTAWYNGLSTAEKRTLIKEHGPIVRFQPTN